MTTTAERLPPGAPAPASNRTILLASLVGTTVEWYDFFLYATAASLVFPRLFFPAHDEVAERILEYHELGFDEFILSGHPHLEEAYWFGQNVLPRLRPAGLASTSLQASNGRAGAMLPIAAR